MYALYVLYFSTRVGRYTCTKFCSTEQIPGVTPYSVHIYIYIYIYTVHTYIYPDRDLYYHVISYMYGMAFSATAGGEILQYIYMYDDGGYPTTKYGVKRKANDTCGVWIGVWTASGPNL